LIGSGTAPIQTNAVPISATAVLSDPFPEVLGRCPGFLPGFLQVARYLIEALIILPLLRTEKDVTDLVNIVM
jgi:hypothetical protein